MQIRHLILQLVRIQIRLRILVLPSRFNKTPLLRIHPNQMPQLIQLIVKTPQLHPTLHKQRIQQRTHRLIQTQVSLRISVQIIRALM